MLISQTKDGWYTAGDIAYIRVRIVGHDNAPPINTIDRIPATHCTPIDKSGQPTSPFAVLYVEESSLIRPQQAVSEVKTLEAGKALHAESI